MNKFEEKLQEVFIDEITQENGIVFLDKQKEGRINQSQVNEVFSEKWAVFGNEDDSVKDVAYDFQKKWFLDLYGFANNEELASRLIGADVIIDAGCGMGYKAAWFAEMSPESLVIGMDYSESIYQAARSNFGKYENLFFVQTDIADTRLQSGCADFIICDQVIMHTEDPQKTLKELARILKQNNSSELLCYWYAKKALPRELLDGHFREHCKTLSNEELWELSKGVLELGKTLSELNIEIDVKEIPALGIKGGKYDLQRFIYWNFIKCFWNDELGYETSLATNFDWYSPSNAKRFSKSEVEQELEVAGLSTSFWHEEEACFSGRFTKI